jgi:S1-C subfamily serine protease
MATLLRNIALAGILGLPAVLTWLAGAGMRAQSSPGQAQVVNRVRSALVEITDLAAGAGSSGNGFIFSSDGRIATSLHVILGLNSSVVRLQNGDMYDRISVLAYDERRDLAIIKIVASDLPVLELGKSSELQPDESILLFDDPPGKNPIEGGVSAFREYEGISVIQTDAANPRNRGGPLVNLRGQVVGILGFKVQPAGNLNFAVPIDYLRALLPGASSGPTPDELAANLRKGTASPQDASAGSLPHFWKSASGLAHYAVRMDGDRISAEPILPSLQRTGSSFNRIEARKSGGVYVGKIFDAGACETSACPFDGQAEFTLVTPTRIEGAAQSHPVRTDCQVCQASPQKQIVKFSWAPE